MKTIYFTTTSQKKSFVKEYKVHLLPYTTRFYGPRACASRMISLPRFAQPFGSCCIHIISLHYKSS